MVAWGQPHAYLVANAIIQQHAQHGQLAACVLPQVGPRVLKAGKLAGPQVRLLLMVCQQFRGAGCGEPAAVHRGARASGEAWVSGAIAPQQMACFWGRARQGSWTIVHALWQMVCPEEREDRTIGRPSCRLVGVVCGEGAGVSAAERLHADSWVEEAPQRAPLDEIASLQTPAMGMAYGHAALTAGSCRRVRLPTIDGMAPGAGAAEAT